MSAAAVPASFAQERTWFLERVGVRDDFFALGGESLLAARLVARRRRPGELEATER